MKTLQNVVVSLLEIRNLKKRTNIKLFSKVIDKNTFCIYSNSIGLYDFAWFCFNTAIPEHQEPDYWDWDELHGLENGCHYFDTYKIEKDRYHPPNNLLWTNEDNIDFNFEYTLEDDDGKWISLQTTIVCIPNDLETLKQSRHPHSRIFVDYEPAIVYNPNLVYDPKYVIYANSAGWYELGKIALFLSKNEKINSVFLSEIDYLYKNSQTLRLSKTKKCCKC
jgi:hypothetical protein